MSKSYNLMSIAEAVGWVTANAELSMLQSTDVSASNSQTITSSTVTVWAWTTSASEPNVADWPAASSTDPWKCVLNVTAIGANVSLSNSSAFHRVRGDAAADLESSNGSWDSTTGTGLKTLTNTTWNPLAGAATDRFGVRILCSTSNTMMDNGITIGSLNTTTTFAQGPWSTGTTFQQALAVVSTFSASLSDVVIFARALSAGSSFVAGLTRLTTHSRNLFAESVFSPSLTRVATYSRTLAATSPFVAGLNRGLFVTLAVASSFAAGLASAKLFTRALSAVSTFSAGLTQQLTLARTLAASSVFGVSLARVIGKMLGVTSPFSVSLQKQMYVSLAVASVFGLELRKMVSKTLAVSSVFAPGVSSSFTAVRSLAATSAMVAAMTTQFIAGTVLVLRRRLLSLLGVE